MVAEIKTNRLILLPVDKSYARPYLTYLKRNKKFHEPWTPACSNNYFTIKSQVRELKNKMQSFKEKRQLKFFIFKKTDLNTIIGDIEFGNIVLGVFLSCYVGYKMDKDKINKGYMAEALRAGIKYMFDRIKLHRIEANVMPRNRRSIKLLVKLGFSKEGISKKYLKINGKWEDHSHYVILNEKIN